MLKDSQLSTTLYIKRLFPNSKFVILKQSFSDSSAKRRILFLMGPYIICSADADLKLTPDAMRWLKEKPYIPLGNLISMINKKVKRTFHSTSENERIVNMKGAISAIVKEKFYKLRKLSVAAFIPKNSGTSKDISIFRRHCRKDADLLLFPESYPFHKGVDLSINGIRDGVIFGEYRKRPATFATINGRLIRIPKITPFANEKIHKSKARIRNIIYMGANIGVITCYDLLNPAVSYALSRRKIDLLLVPAYIPKSDISRWINFARIRGYELQAPVIVVSATDRKGISANAVIFFDPITEKVNVYNKSRIIDVFVGERMLQSPKIHWSWLLRNKVYGPFPGDFQNLSGD